MCFHQYFSIFLAHHFLSSAPQGPLYPPLDAFLRYDLQVTLQKDKTSRWIQVQVFEVKWNYACLLWWNYLSRWTYLLEESLILDWRWPSRLRKSLYAPMQDCDTSQSLLLHWGILKALVGQKGSWLYIQLHHVVLSAWINHFYPYIFLLALHFTEHSFLQLRDSSHWL